MADLDLTPEETSLVERLAHERQGVPQRILFHAVVLLPLIAFAVHGLRKDDLDAVAVAFGGVLLFDLWRVFEELRHAALFQSVFRKLSQHGRPTRDEDGAERA